MMFNKVFAFMFITLCGSSYNSAKQYVIPYAKASWMGAVEYCNRNNMRLAVITSSEENSRVVDEILSVQANDANTLHSVWIGASDNFQEGSFIWHATGEPVNYTDWARSQPDNHSKTEDCVEIANRKYTKWVWAWNDLICTKEQNFVCENYSVDEQQQNRTKKSFGECRQ